MRGQIVRRKIGVGFGALLALILGGGAWGVQAQEFENLKFFPEDITRPELIGNMRKFSFALGVRCTFCHAGDEDVPFNERDFASDERATKRKARKMLEMVRDINEKYLAFLPDRRSPNVAVECATCHGGVRRPEQIDRIIERLIEEEDLDFAVERYRSLRERYLPSAAYDFGEQPLVELGSRLGRVGNVEAATTVFGLNLEFNPESAQSMLGLAQIHDQAGDAEAAIEWYEKSLEIGPDDPRVRQRIDQLKGR
jgi:tetratricopeptide (TPR) repeat protein